MPASTQISSIVTLSKPRARARRTAASRMSALVWRRRRSRSPMQLAITLIVAHNANFAVKWSSGGVVDLHLIARANDVDGAARSNHCCGAGPGSRQLVPIGVVCSVPNRDMVADHDGG